MAWVLAWPATNPTARSPDAVGVAAPELAVVPEVEVAVDAEPSTGLVVATPANSCTETAMEAAEAVCTVTVVAAWALAEYQSAPSELWPEANLSISFVQVLPAESVTEVMWLEAPTYSLADRTSRFPVVVAAGNVAVREVAVPDSQLPVDCTIWGGVLAGVVTESAVRATCHRPAPRFR